MKYIAATILLSALSISQLWAADGTHVSVAQTQDAVLSRIKHELIALAQAMPSGKYNFAPTKGQFKGVRTFGQQISHTATVVYQISARVLGEKTAIDTGNTAMAQTTCNQRRRFLSTSKTHLSTLIRPPTL